MGFTVLVSVPLGMAFLFLLQDRLTTFPRWLPVLLLLTMPLACLENVSQLHNAIATNTRFMVTGPFDTPLLTFHMDGLSLLFVLLIAIAAAAASLCAVLLVEDRDAYRRLIRSILALVGLLTGFVLAEHTMTVFVAGTLCLALGTMGFVQPVSNGQTPSWQGWRGTLGRYAFLGIQGLFLFSLTLIQESGAAARQLTTPVYEVSQLSTGNLSKGAAYEPVFASFLITMLVLCVYVLFRWNRQRRLQIAHLFLPVIVFVLSLYPVARFYPALHDNPLWWTVVPGAGLLMMLLGAVYALRQTDQNRLLIGTTLSGFGACLALLGLPDYLGVQAALMGIGVYSLSLAGLFLTVGLSRTPKTSVGPAIFLATLATAFIDVWTINAFYAAKLPWIGGALAVVILSTALLTMSMIRLLQPMGIEQWWYEVSNTERSQAWDQERLQGGLAIALTFIALVFALIFSTLFGPLLPALSPQKGADVDISAVGLSLLAWGGGIILYLTRGAWGAFRSVAQSNDIPFTIKTPES